MKTCGGLVLSFAVGLVLLFGSCVAFVTYATHDAAKREAAEDAKLTPEEKAAKGKAERVDANGMRLRRYLKEWVMTKLKSPTTAKVDLGYSVSQDLLVITVFGTVDSQNSFGAIIRSNIKATYDAETMECLSINWDQP